MDSAKTVIIDCDGVLTDGKVWYNQVGDRMKGFHSRDIRAIRELISHGFEVLIVTASTWPGLKDFAKRTGAEVIFDREKLPLNIRYYAIGDDTPDMAMLQGAEQCFCPHDADPAILGLKEINVLRSKGGEGCIAEMINIMSYAL